jgi:hypothetical protein
MAATPQMGFGMRARPAGRLNRPSCTGGAPARGGRPAIALVARCCRAGGGCGLAERQPQGLLGAELPPGGLRRPVGVGVEPVLDGPAGQVGLHPFGADRAHAGVVAGGVGGGQQERGPPGPPAAERDQGVADQDQGGGRRLRGREQEAGRLPQVGVGVVEVAEAGLGAGQLGEGVGDAPADQLADDGQGLLVQLAGAFEVTTGAGDAAQLVVEVGEPAALPGPAEEGGRLLEGGNDLVPRRAVEP